MDVMTTTKHAELVAFQRKMARDLGLPIRVVRRWNIPNFERYFAFEEERVAAGYADVAAQRTLTLAWQERPDLLTFGDFVAAGEHDPHLAEVVARYQAAGRAVDDVESRMIAAGYLGESKRRCYFDGAGDEVP